MNILKIDHPIIALQQKLLKIYIQTELLGQKMNALGISKLVSEYIFSKITDKFKTNNSKELLQ